MRIKNENMKKYLIIMAVPLMMLSSCEENMEDLFPSEYQKVLSVKNSGQTSLVMASASKSYAVDIIVLKGGGNPSSDSEMSFRVMTDDEVAEEWNWSPSQVEIIGEEGFEIEGGDNIVIPADESYRRISLTLHPSVIAAMTKQDSETWILPLVLESSTDNVNQDMNKMLYTLDLRDLTLEWDDFPEETRTVEITYLEEEVPLTMVMAYAEANEFTFTATLDDSRTDELVTAFNASPVGSGIFLRSWNKGIFQNRYPEQDRTRIRQDISPSARLYRIGRCGLQVGRNEISDCHQSQVFHGGCGPDHVLDCFHEFRDRVGMGGIQPDRRGSRQWRDFRLVEQV